MKSEVIDLNMSEHQTVPVSNVSKNEIVCTLRIERVFFHLVSAVFDIVIHIW